MNSTYYTDIASRNPRIPVGTHLELHRHNDADAIVLDGPRLGQIFLDAANRYQSPLAIPLMDLTLEKDALLLALGIPSAETHTHHLSKPATPPKTIPLTPRMTALCHALKFVAGSSTRLPVGMSIGPFSLMTKLLADPIMPVFLAGTGLTAEDEPEIALVENALQLAEQVIHAYISAQIAAGAKAIFLCEPAANLVYFSPKQQDETNYAVFEKYVMLPMRRLNALLEKNSTDLIFHDCGELTDEMVRRFSSLNPRIMSLGASRKLWEDALIVPKTTVLYGNLPSKQFYSTQLTAAQVAADARNLIEKMNLARHPFILGTECDVLSVPGSENEIESKITALLSA